MPTELEELVEFLHHGNSQIRQVASTNLLGYFTSQPAVFKRNEFEPIRDLKLLVKDYPPISKNALTILINLSEDRTILKLLASDDAFLESLLLRITNEKEENADEIAMLLANLAKSDSMLRILKLKRSIPRTLSTSPQAIDQLMDCFVKGASGSYNKHANYDYLSYFFADLAKHPECRDYFLTPQASDSNVIPLSKLLVFTEHTSHIRRLGVASTIKNLTFDVGAHPKLLAPHYISSTSAPILTIASADAEEAQGPDPLNLLPYILLPLCGPEDFSTEDMDEMLEDLQLLPPDKTREPDQEILKTHLETLLLLTTSREGRDTLRRVKIYPVLRELHIKIEDEEVGEGVDRLVQVLMRDEEGEEQDVGASAGMGRAAGMGGAMVTQDDGVKDGKMAGLLDAKARRRTEESIVQEVDSDDEVVEVM